MVRSGNALRTLLGVRGDSNRSARSATGFSIALGRATPVGKDIYTGAAYGFSAGPADKQNVWMTIDLF